MGIRINTFTKHPEEVGMTYLQHLKFAFNLARLAFMACLASLVHALLPFLFANTTSRITLQLFYMLKSRLPEDEIDQINFQHITEFDLKK